MKLFGDVDSSSAPLHFSRVAKKCVEKRDAISILDALPIAKIQDNHAVKKMSYRKDKCLTALQKNPIWIENHQKLMQFAERI